MTKFHRNLNIMSCFTACLLVCVIVFWHTFMNIAVSSVFLNGIIIGTTIFGIGLCFVNIFQLLPEYKWMHAYFDGRADYGFSPRLLRPVALILQNKHSHINTTTLTELLDLISLKIEDKRDSVRYITNALIFLGLLGTFWGLIITVGGFADVLMHLDFADEDVLQYMQRGMALPLSGMATAFTSSLLGLAGSLIVGFLGMQIQLAQNTVFNELSDFMSMYVLQHPTDCPNITELSESAPVNEATYTNISNIYDAIIDAKYDIRDLIRIGGKYPAVIAAGTNEQLLIATANAEEEVLKNIKKRFELCFADTLEGINIKVRILALNTTTSGKEDDIIYFTTMNSLKRYLKQHENTVPRTTDEIETFSAYVEYIDTVIQYLFK